MKAFLRQVLHEVLVAIREGPMLYFAPVRAAIKAVRLRHD